MHKQWPEASLASLRCFNPLSANPTKWSNTLKQFVGNSPTNCLSVFDHFVKLALKGLIVIFERAILLKNRLAQDFWSKFCAKFLKHLFEEHLQTAASAETFLF